MVGEVPAFPWRGVSQIPPKTLLFLRVSGPVPSPGGGVLPCPALPWGLLWSRGPRRAPCPGTRRPGAGPTRLRPALLAGRWHPPSAQSTAGSGAGPAAGRGTGRTPRPRGRWAVGSYRRKRRSCLCRRCSPSFFSFLPLLRRHLPGWDGRERKMHNKTRSPGAAITPGLNCPRWGLSQLPPQKARPSLPPPRRQTRACSVAQVCQEGLQCVSSPHPAPRPPRPATSRSTRVPAGGPPRCSRGPGAAEDPPVSHAQ